MLIITNAGTDKIQVISSAAVTLDVSCSWVDLLSTTVTPGRTNTAITTATTTDIVATPAASTVRNVKMINIRNKHASTSCDVTVQFNQNATLFELVKVTLAAGQVLEYVEGVGWYVLASLATSELMKVLAADDAGGQNVATAQPWFPTQGAVTVAADTTYNLNGVLMMSRAAGVTSHTTSLVFAGTATYTISYMAKVQVGETMALLPLSRVFSSVATATVVKAASTTATEQFTLDFEGILRVTAAGTFIPQFIYSAAPGGTPTILKNTRLVLTPLGSASFVSQGAWA